MGRPRGKLEQVERTALSVRLFGGLELRRASGEPIPIGSARIASLLAYLLLNRSSHSRQRLASLLWPESTESQSRTNLRHLLHELKRSVPDIERFVEIGAQTLQMRADALATVDVDRFEDELEKVEAATDLEPVRQAVDLYRGDLLDGIDADWSSGKREELRVRCIGALEQLASRLGSSGAYTEAVRHAERLLELDPLREKTYRLLMQLHEANGARARALRVYHTCTATLARELGVSPSKATRQAYESLLAEQTGDTDPATDGTDSETVPLVGRDRELQLFQNAWLLTERGRSQLVIVSGEAGIGKTRMVEEFRDWCARRGANTAEARAYAAEGALAYSPIVAWLRADAFRTRLAQADAWRPTLGKLLPEVVESSKARVRMDAVSKAEERQKLFDAVAAIVLGSDSPTLLVADDVQWFDPDSLQCLHYLIRSDRATRLMVVATLRKEDVGPSHALGEVIAGARALDRCVEIELGGLTPEDTATLAKRIGHAALPSTDAHQLYRETDGNPLFIVEALRAGWRSTGERWTSPRVQSVIESRLARLSPPARELLATAAAIGREFTTDVLARASDISGQPFVNALDELWRRRLIRERGTRAYDFSHDKIREVADLGSSPARRSHDHLRIARALEEIHVLDSRAVSGIIAAHYERAGAIGSAITWYEHAAAAALELGASTDARRILERALAALAGQPPGADRDMRELSILTTLVPLLGSVEGYGSADVDDTLRRAQSLAEARALEFSPPLLRSMAMSSLTKGRFVEAGHAGEQLRARADHAQDPVLRVEAEYILGISAFWRGDLRAARAHFEGAVAHYSPKHRATHLVHYGQDPKVICSSRLANTLWLLGEFDGAWNTTNDALRMADEIGHLHSRATALTFATLMAIEAHDDARVRGYAASLSAMSHQRESIQSRIASHAIAGYVDVLDGRFDDGISRIRGAIEDLRGAEHAPGIHVALARILLEALERANQPAAGLEAADRALASSGNVRIFEAEFRRLRAGFLAALGGPAEEIATELAQASDVARQQGAVAFELRIREARALLK